MAAAERSGGLLAGETADICASELRTSFWTLVAAAVKALLLVVGIEAASEAAWPNCVLALLKTRTIVEEIDLPPETLGVPAAASWVAA